MIPDWLSQGLPVRSGGKNANEERVALDALGGPAGFKTREVRLADGTVMRVQTKGDMPPQVTRVKEVAPPEQTEWRLWHGLMREYWPSMLSVTSGDGSVVRSVDGVAGVGSMKLVDWGSGGGFKDGDVIDVSLPTHTGLYVNVIDVPNAKYSDFYRGDTYYSAFALIPKERRDEVRAEGDYTIVARSGTLVSNRTELAGGVAVERDRTNSPFGNHSFLPGLTWPFKNADDEIIFYTVQTLENKTSFKLSVLKNKNGNQTSLGDYGFTLPDLYGGSQSTIGTGREYSPRMVQYNRTGARALIHIYLTGRMSGITPLADALVAVLKADLTGEDRVAVSVFKNHGELFSSSNEVESSLSGSRDASDERILSEGTAVVEISSNEGHEAWYTWERTQRFQGAGYCSVFVTRDRSRSSYGFFYGLDDEIKEMYAEAVTEYVHFYEVKRSGSTTARGSHSGHDLSLFPGSASGSLEKTTDEFTSTMSYSRVHVGENEFEFETDLGGRSSHGEWRQTAGPGSKLSIPNPTNSNIPPGTYTFDFSTGSGDGLAFVLTVQSETSGVTTRDFHEPPISALYCTRITNNLLAVMVCPDRLSQDYDSMPIKVMAHNTTLEMPFNPSRVNALRYGYASWNPRTGEIAVSQEGEAVQWV